MKLIREVDKMPVVLQTEMLVVNIQSNFSPIETLFFLELEKMAVMKSMLILLSVAAGAVAQQSAYGQCTNSDLGWCFEHSMSCTDKKRWRNRMDRSNNLR
jgi:hypothetical protein